MNRNKNTKQSIGAMQLANKETDKDIKRQEDKLSEKIRASPNCNTTTIPLYIVQSFNAKICFKNVEKYFFM